MVSGEEVEMRSVVTDEDMLRKDWFLSYETSQLVLEPKKACWV